MQTGLGTQEKQCRSRLCRYVLSASDGVQVYYAGESFFGMTGFLRDILKRCAAVRCRRLGTSSTGQDVEFLGAVGCKMA